ncbi:MAG: dihydrolipoamide acetyltransferase family protein [Bacillota bacterium]
MAVEIIMPQLGLTMTHGTVTKWLKKEGDPVRKGEPVVEIMSDKASFEVEAPADGVLLKIAVPEGEVVPIATVIGYIGQAGEKVDGPQADVFRPEPGRADGELRDEEAKAGGVPPLEEKEEIRGERLFVSPRARRAAREHGLSEEDLRKIAGSGPHGRIREKDVLARVTPLARRVAEAHAVDLSGIRGTDLGGKITRQDVLEKIKEAEKAQDIGEAGPGIPILKVVPLAGVRKIIAERMSQSAFTKPHVTLTTEVDMTEMLSLRKQINDASTDAGVISVTDIIVKVCALALERHPEVNAALEGNEIKLLARINIGIAVATDRGLVVPVVKEANRKALGQISREARDLITRAREGKLKPDELQGGTFTVSNLGMYEIDAFTPIINPLESALLGVGRLVKKPAVREDEITVRTMMILSLSFDHRVLDGAPAAAFLRTVKQVLENPLRLITGV